MRVHSHLTRTRSATAGEGARRKHGGSLEVIGKCERRAARGSLHRLVRVLCAASRSAFDSFHSTSVTAITRTIGAVMNKITISPRMNFATKCRQWRANQYHCNKTHDSRDRLARTAANTPSASARRSTEIRAVSTMESGKRSQPVAIATHTKDSKDAPIASIGAL